MLILDRICNQLGRNGTELYRPRRQTLRRLPDFGVLHFSRADRSDNFRHHSRFQIIVQDVSAWETDASSAGACELRMTGFEARHMSRWVARPGLAADILIKAAVTIGNDIETCDFLVL